MRYGAHSITSNADAAQLERPRTAITQPATHAETSTTLAANETSKPSAQADTDAAQEVAPPAATKTSDTLRARISPALALLVHELDQSIEACPRSRHFERTVSLASLRNLSHATPREFDAMRSRLADLLSTAAELEGSTLRFVAGENDPAQFDLQGAAYLATLDGFDSWELYVGLTRRESMRDLWRSTGPVRVLRFEQPKSAQVFYAGASTR